MQENGLKLLPPDMDLETKNILKQLARSHRALAELKGFADTIPNKNILINAVTINEAKDSSEIENIIRKICMPNSPFRLTNVYLKGLFHHSPLCSTIFNVCESGDGSKLLKNPCF